MVGLEILVVDIGIQYYQLHHQSITNKVTAKCFDQEKQTKTYNISILPINIRCNQGILMTLIVVSIHVFGAILELYCMHNM